MSPLDVIEGRARWCVVEGDAAEVLRVLPAASINAVVTDPPAGIAFMGAEWDGAKGGRAQWVAWLCGVLGLARAATVPGGRAIVWALPRTAHWTGCAVEDAGWSIETKLYHLFGTGWPKGKSQLKPSAEEWVLARTGPSTPLNVDGSRVGTDAILIKGGGGGPGTGWGLKREINEPRVGRWPPNVLLSHSAGCVRDGVRRVQGSHDTTGVWNSGTGYSRGSTGATTPGYTDHDGTELVESWRCVEGCPARVLGEQSGERPSGARAEGVRKGLGYCGAEGDGGPAIEASTGTASRFFPQFEPDEPDEVFRYIAKPSRGEREAGLRDAGLREAVCKTGLGGAMPVDDDGNDRDRTTKTARNVHPTVKPIELMRWLVRLVTQPGDIVLDPFGGSGTTGVAALLEGRRVILVEREPAYAAICRARLAHAAPTAADLTRKVAAPIAAPAADFGPLFGGAR